MVGLASICRFPVRGSSADMALFRQCGAGGIEAYHFADHDHRLENADAQFGGEFALAEPLVIGHRPDGDRHQEVRFAGHVPRALNLLRAGHGAFEGVRDRPGLGRHRDQDVDQDARLDASRIDHRHVADDNALGAQAAQTAQHSGFRQADRIRRDAGRLQVIAPDTGEQFMIKFIQCDEIRHIRLFSDFFRRKSS